MDFSNSCPDAESPRTCRKSFWDIEKSAKFWGEARGESRKISVARLKCAPHSEHAEAMALTIWERMTPEHYRLISEIERLLAAHEEIRVAVLRETLGLIFESLNVDIKDLRAINPVPIEALTLLLNHIIKIYNMNLTDVSTGEELVPLSERIKEQASRAEKHGFGPVNVSSNMYVSDRAKLAMLQTQLLGRLKLKTGPGAKFQKEWRQLKFKLNESCKKDESKRKLRRVLEIKQKLREAQETLGNTKIRITYKTGKIKKCRSRLSKAESVNNSNCSLFTANQDSSVESVMSDVEDGTSCLEVNTVEDTPQKASIDTSSWVISPTHEYYFGSSPPVIPKTTATHEVYPKPVETKMEPVERVEDAKVEQSGWEISRDISKSGSVIESGTSLNSRYMSTTSLGNVDDRETCEESHGDASTIFAWTEPEKSASYCLNTGEKTAFDDIVTEGVSDAAGDGCDLARTQEESNMVVLKADEQEIHEFSSGAEQDLPDVPLPSPFSMTDIVDTDCTISNESIGFHNRNLFSCNEYVQESNTLITPCNFKQYESSSEHQTYGNASEEVEESVEVHENEKTNTNAQKMIFDKPPAEPNEKKITDSSKKRSFGVKLVNQSVMDELTDVLKRSSTNEQTENPDDVMTAYGSSASTSEGVDPNGRDEILSSGDSVLKIAEETTKSEFAIPAPPPMPPLQDIDNSFGLQYDAYPQRVVDEFQSAADFRGTQVLYMRPTSVRQGKKKAPQRSSVNTQENESDENQTGDAPSGRESTPGKRNDMVTLAVLAFAVGIGTLGYMTIAATGSNLCPEILGAAGGKALNVIEKALQALKTLNNRL